MPKVWGIRGAVTSIAWAKGDIGETLIYGTSLGFLVAWRQNSDKVLGRLYLRKTTLTV